MFQYHFLRLLGEMILQFLNTHPNTTNILGEPNFSLYLRGVGMKYWDIPILIGERERFWGTAGVYLLHNIDSLLRKRRLLEML